MPDDTPPYDPMPMRAMHYHGSISAADRTPSGARAMLAAQLRAHADAIENGDFAESGNGGPATHHAWHVNDPWNPEGVGIARYLLGEAVELLQALTGDTAGAHHARVLRMARTWLENLGTNEQPPHVPCCDTCDHSPEEHSAFMRGWMNAMLGTGAECREQDDTQAEAWLAGQSVAQMCFRRHTPPP